MFLLKTGLASALDEAVQDFTQASSVAFHLLLGHVVIRFQPVLLRESSMPTAGT